eukprot:30927-Pelagococcus_subviridis.AAC.8
MSPGVRDFPSAGHTCFRIAGSHARGSYFGAGAATSIAATGGVTPRRPRPDLAVEFYPRLVL